MTPRPHTLEATPPPAPTLPPTPTWVDLVAVAMLAPSPHNTQPWVLEAIDGQRAHLCYDPARLLPDTDASGRFQTIALGIFTEALHLAALASGHSVVPIGAPARLDFSPGEPRRILELRLERSGEAEPAGADGLAYRCTNRRPYDGTPVAAETAEQLARIGAFAGHEVVLTSSPDLVDWVVGLNTETLFYDLSDPVARGELGRWIRSSHGQEWRTRDGLSARCLGFPGPLVGAFFRHHWLAQLPGVRPALRVYYRRSQRGTATVGWVRGPQRGPEDWFAAGRMLLRLWLAIGDAGLALHPYGSMITNPASHRRLAERLKVSEDPGEELWLLFRIGYPTRTARQSLRLDLDEVVR